MADNADPHPAPDLPDTGPVPHFPVGTPKPLRSPPPQPSVQENEEVPGEDYPPARQPFPDDTPDPGITHR